MYRYDWQSANHDIMNVCIMRIVCVFQMSFRHRREYFHFAMKSVKHWALKQSVFLFYTFLLFNFKHLLNYTELNFSDSIEIFLLSKYSINILFAFNMLVFKLSSKIRIISLLFNIKLIYLSKYLICNNMKNENY